LAKGNEISLLAKKALGSKLKKALQEGGTAHAVEFCNVAAYPILDSVRTEIPVEIRRAALRYRNPKDSPTEREKEIIEEYQKRVTLNKSLDPVVIDLNDEQVLYARPILLDNALCLNCHGEVGSQINEETNNLLNSLYPEDKAKGHQMGDLRGIWSLVFRKEDL